MNKNNISDNLWARVSRRLSNLSKKKLFKYGQQNSINWIAGRIKENGIIIADEVGLGKTRVALLVMLSVLEEGGDVVAVVPPGLLSQWNQEILDVILAMEHAGCGPTRKWKVCIIRTYEDLFTALEGKEKFPIAKNKEGRWVLISQSFDIYQIKSNAKSWRLELPALINAYRDKKDTKSTKWTKYLKKRSKSMEYGYVIQHKAAIYLAARKFDIKFQSILENNCILPNPKGEYVANSKCTEYFQAGQDGRKLLMNLVGRLIGDIDLLVMDEAHKSREEGDTPQKRLGRLLEEILKTTKCARRISITATPVELNPEQWISLLKRTGIDKNYPGWDNIKNVMDGFSNALAQAQDRPDEPIVLEHLMLISKQFENALAPFVTRRRRIMQEEMISLLPPNYLGAHPHRHLNTYSINIEKLPDQWRTMVFALEGQGLASKGIKEIGVAQKQADIRYSSGLNCEFELVNKKGTNNKELSRREVRTKAWAQLQQRTSQELSASGEWLWSHPRVIYAADRIEQLCNFKGLYPQEKILVFGRFSDPMRALRETLSARHLLRILDSGEVALIPRCNAEHLFFTYMSQMRIKTFNNFLKVKSYNREEIQQLVKQAHNRYDNARDTLRDLFNGESEEWIDEQPGDKALRNLKTHSTENYQNIIELIRSDIFDVLLYERELPAKGNIKRIHQLAHEAWVKHLKCILHDSDERSSDVPDNSNGKPTDNCSGDKILAKLDQKADLIDPGRFKLYLDKEPRSNFCRILDGEVEHTTRKSIQAAFNRPDIGPYVLITQSTIGREGLNLHKACRKVFLFHPEWNPGVMEQQIGRVDRIESLWSKMAETWNQGLKIDDFPKIEVESLVFQGTYDEYQANILKLRRNTLNAQLFGVLLDEETLEKVPTEYKERLAEAAPDWSPISLKK